MTLAGCTVHKAMEIATIDESAVVTAARDGDQSAFGVLVRQYQRRAYAVAYSVVGNREDSLELAQESFVRAYRAIDRFDPTKPFYPWLYRIVKNTCFNHLKKKKRRAETSLDKLMAAGYDAQDSSRNPQDMAELGDLKRAVHAAMELLTADQQEIIRLRHFLELSYSEIAACLDIPQGTVMSRLHGARKQLRCVMQGATGVGVNT